MVYLLLKKTFSERVGALQKLQSDVSFFQVFNNNIQLVRAGLSVEVSQEGNVETMELVPPEKTHSVTSLQITKMNTKNNRIWTYPCCEFYLYLIRLKK